MRGMRDRSLAAPSTGEEEDTTRARVPLPHRILRQEADP